MPQMIGVDNVAFASIGANILYYSVCGETKFYNEKRQYNSSLIRSFWLLLKKSGYDKRTYLNNLSSRYKGFRYERYFKESARAHTL